MLRKNLLLFHFVVWIILAQFALLPLYVYGASAKAVYSFGCFILVAGIFYVNLLIIIPKWISRRKGAILLEWFGVTFATTVFSFFLSHWTGVFMKPGYPLLEWINSFLRAALITTVAVAMSTAYKSIADWFNNDRRSRELQTRHLRMELELLKSRIDPHFLLNSLNSIYILAYTKSPLTADAVMTLSGIMKYMLNLSADTPVLLKDEISYIEQVIALHEIRSSSPFCLEYAVSGQMDGFLIQPLLLMAFIENIFKHGIISNPDDPALIKIDNQEGQLTLTCRNQIDPHPADQHGIGLSNARRRLELLYPHRHSIEQRTVDGHYYVTLHIRL